MSRKQNQQRRAWIGGLLYLVAGIPEDLTQHSSGIKQAGRYAAIVSVKQRAHSIPRRREGLPMGRKDHCDPPKPKAQWQRPGHTQGTKGGVPLLSQGVQERSRSSLESLFCSSAQLQGKKDQHLHLYLIVVEVAVNRKPVRFHFCSCYHGELGPLPYSCTITDRPGQGSTVMFLLALGLQSAAFITWITWTKWNKWNRISILYSCTTLLANTNTGRRLVVEEFILFYIFAEELGMGTWQKAVGCLQWTEARVCWLLENFFFCEKTTCKHQSFKNLSAQPCFH